MFGKRNRQERDQTEFLCRMSASFGYDAIGLGEQDLNYGLEFLERMIEEYHLPFTSANVRDAATGDLILPEYLVVERGGVRFGIVSVLDPNQKIVAMTAKDTEYQVDDPVATLRRVVPRLRERCDTVVLLSHMAERGTEDLLAEIAGLDVAVVGHTFRSYQTERITNDVVMLAAVHEGRYIGRADLRIDPENGQVMAVEVEVTSLDDEIPDDETMAQEVENFKQQVEARREAQRAEWPRDKGSHDELFLGVNNCKNCHLGVYDTWRANSHSSAYTTIRAKDMQFEPECLACHTTGYQYYNGYEQQGSNSHLVNVQCEACHGYGTEHARDDGWGAEAKDSCTQCHVGDERPCFEPGDGQFDFASYWDRIKH